MELPGRRKSVRPKKTFLHVGKEDVEFVSVTEKEAEDRTRWKQTICCSDP